MATISENLQIIADSTSAIKQAIIDKGGEITGDITTWADAISGIETSGGSEINKFNIGSNEFVFENDMTWGDYINSIYNVIHCSPSPYGWGKFTISVSDTVCGINSAPISSSSIEYVPVYTTDKIIPNGIYYMSVGGSGGSGN